MIIKDILLIKIISKENNKVLVEWEPKTINENDYSFNKETELLYLRQLPDEAAGNQRYLLVLWLFFF